MWLCSSIEFSSVRHKCAAESHPPGAFGQIQDVYVLGRTAANAGDRFGEPRHFALGARRTAAASLSGRTRTRGRRRWGGRFGFRRSARQGLPAASPRSCQAQRRTPRPLDPQARRPAPDEALPPVGARFRHRGWASVALNVQGTALRPRTATRSGPPRSSIATRRSGVSSTRSAIRPGRMRPRSPPMPSRSAGAVVTAASYSGSVEPVSWPNGLP